MPFLFYTLNYFFSYYTSTYFIKDNKIILGIDLIVESLIYLP